MNSVVPEYESLESTEADLEQMMLRLQLLLAQPLDEHGFVELCSIYNNVAYIFLYLDSNEAHVAYGRLLPWKARFFDDASLNKLVLERMMSLELADPDHDASRAAYVDRFQRKSSSDPAADARANDLLEIAKSAQTDLLAAQAGLLERLGVRSGVVSSPGVGLYKLLASTTSQVTRERLGAAWRKATDANVMPLVSAIDAVIEERRARAHAAGYSTVLEQTLGRCSVTAADAWSVAEEYLVGSMQGHEVLVAEIEELVPNSSEPMDHFACFVQARQGARVVPEFAVDKCLRLLVEVALECFGLVIQEESNSEGPVRRLSAWSDGSFVGVVTLDLWDTGRRTSNNTRGIRSRIEYDGFVQHPAAYVSCRFRRASDGVERITFQNAHSLFHEFGHAMNHLLMQKRFPTESGLEYLPLERIEVLSMWFEKWVYHEAFSEAVCDSEETRRGLQLCWEIKKLEYRRSHVERAVSAALDFVVHESNDLSLADAFSKLDASYGISRYCNLREFPGYFLWPMYQANPGANFSYIWGAAESARLFAPFEDSALGDWGREGDASGWFGACFDAALPSFRPSVAPLFSFYEGGPRVEVDGL